VLPQVPTAKPHHKRPAQDVGRLILLVLLWSLKDAPHCETAGRIEEHSSRPGEDPGQCQLDPYVLEHVIEGANKDVPFRAILELGKAAVRRLMRDQPVQKDHVLL
jgi:hypothetical protein